MTDNVDDLTLYGFRHSDRVRDTYSSKLGTVRLRLATADDLADGCDPIIGEVTWDQPTVDANTATSTVFFEFSDELEMCAAVLQKVSE